MANDVSTDKDLTDTISDFLSQKKQAEESTNVSENHVQHTPRMDSKEMQEVVETFEKMEATPKVRAHLVASTPPPSPADYKVDNNVDVFKQSFQTANGKDFYLYNNFLTMCFTIILLINWQ